MPCWFPSFCRMNRCMWLCVRIVIDGWIGFIFSEFIYVISCILQLDLFFYFLVFFFLMFWMSTFREIGVILWLCYHRFSFFHFRLLSSFVLVLRVRNMISRQFWGVKCQIFSGTVLLTPPPLGGLQPPPPDPHLFDQNIERSCRWFSSSLLTPQSHALKMDPYEYFLTHHEHYIYIYGLLSNKLDNIFKA